MKNKNLDLPSAFFFRLLKKIKKNKKNYLITADQGAWALEKFQKEVPRQYFNVGVSEQNMIGLAAGMSIEGNKIFVYAISSFVTQRCLEQIKVDLCIPNIPVVLIGSGSTLTYSFHGPTHQAIEDIAMMRSLPNMNILNPCDNISAEAAVEYAMKSSGPVYIKLDKGFFPNIYSNRKDCLKGMYNYKSGRDITIITTGYMTHKTKEICEILKKYNLNPSLINVFKIKPFDKKIMIQYCKKSDLIITIEEQNIIGGLGSIVAEIIADENIKIDLIRIGINDIYSEKYGDRDWLHRHHGIDVGAVVNRILKHKSLKK